MHCSPARLLAVTPTCSACFVGSVLATALAVLAVLGAAVAGALPVATQIHVDAAPPFHVDVVVFADVSYRSGVAALINSSRVHSAAPLRFFVGFDGRPEELYSYLECVGVSTADV